MEKLTQKKKDIIAEINTRVDDKVLERSNADLLIKLIRNADSDDEAVQIAALGTTYKRTGMHFDKRLDKPDNTIHYFKKNEKLSFSDGKSEITHKLIIGDNYYALQNLLIQYRGGIDVIYIDPPYGKDSMGEFGKTNYDNAITRDNLLSMLYTRLLLAKQLLSDNGVIFCSIDDKNQAYVKCLFDEIFGENKFLFNIPRQTIKGGKTTTTIQKNNDYILCYTNNLDILFSQEDKTDLAKYKYEDEFVKERGKYALTQTLDYNSLEYSEGMDYVLEYEGKKYIPGGNWDLYKERHNGNHGIKDWIWRWSEKAVEWGIKNKMLELKGDRIYTKSYMYCRKKTGQCEMETIDTKKAFTTLSYIDNEYSNTNANKELSNIFPNGKTLFRNPKSSTLIKKLTEMIDAKDDAIILDFFAGSGTTGHAVLELNKNNGNKQFILCQLNEKTDTTPNGIAYDVTAKRLKRIMTGECYDGSKDFPWIKNNKPYGGNLDVYDVESIPNNAAEEGKTPFDVIDETLYGEEKMNAKDKIAWVCSNFSNTQNHPEEDDEWEERVKKLVED